MRLFFTFILVILTLVLGSWFARSVSKNGRDGGISDSQSLPAGSRLINEEDIIKTRRVVLTNPHTKPHEFILNRHYQWECVRPYKDRADGVLYMNPLLKFALTSEIIDSTPLSAIDPADYGFDKNWVRVEFQDEAGKTLTSFKIGKSSAWCKRIITKDAKNEQIITDIPTVFVIKEDAKKDRTLYLVADGSSSIQKLFKDNFAGFRDHRPFALRRHTLEQVRIKQSGREIILDHTTTASPWFISKPLDLPVDNKAISKLLVGISQLSAIKLHPRESITLPEASPDDLQIAIKNRYSETETILTVYTPKTGDNATTCYATVSDRPDIIFELPLQPSDKIKTTISTLPLSINKLRRKSMISLNRNNIRGFIIRNQVTAPIIIARKKRGDKYKLLPVGGGILDVNEVAITNLIAAVSIMPVKAFVSDAAADISLYNLNDPSLIIDIRPLAGKNQRVTFARKDGHIYAMANGKNVVWEIEPKVYASIPKKEWEWKTPIIWELLLNDVTDFSIARPGQPVTRVHYDYLGDSFTCKVGNQDLSEKLNPIQAKFFLNNNHVIAAQKRLGPHHELAQKALENPILIVNIQATAYDDEGLPTDKKDSHTIRIAPATRSTNRPAFYYAKADNDPDYLIISPSTYHRLNIDLFSDE